MAGKSISNDLRSKDQFKTEVVKWAEKITVNPGQIRIQKMKKMGVLFHKRMGLFQCGSSKGTPGLSGLCDCT